jgi:hypothetical protein
MTKITTPLVCAIAMMLSTAVQAVPSSVHASYNVMRNGLHIAVITERYENSDNTYSIVSNSKAVGLFALVQRKVVSVVSRGNITRAGLQPLQFNAQRAGRKARRVLADFDWKAATLKMQFDGRTETATLQRGTQDRLSIMYQFMHMPPPRKHTFEFAMTNGRKLDHYRYAVTPNVTIDTPYQRLVTLHLVKLREPDESVTEIWLSPVHHFVPAKLLIIEDDGVRYEQLLTGLEVKP